MEEIVTFKDPVLFSQTLICGRIEKFVKTKGTIEKARINTIFFGHNYTYDHLDLFCDPIFTRGKQQCAVEKSLGNQSVAHKYLVFSQNRL